MGIVKETFDTVPILLKEGRRGCLAGYYAIKDTHMTYRLYEFFNRALNRPGLEKIKKLFFELEMPFINIVWDSEQHGVKFDLDYINNTVAPQLHKEYEELQSQIYSYLGEINLKSPKQLSEVLYKKLNLPVVNKKKADSTDRKTLKKLKNAHPVIPLLLEFRAKAKLIDAFVEKLPKNVVNGRIHTSFQTIGCVTGRMSSSNPNLQQLPAGNLIRNAFVADEGRLLLSCDFSSQELRWLGELSKDSLLMDIYKNNKDVHSMTGTKIWNMQNPDKQLTYEEFCYCRGMYPLFHDADGNLIEGRFNDTDYINQLFTEGKINTVDPVRLKEDAVLGKKLEKIRKFAKTVNFGTVYGIGASSLADTLEVSEEEAQMFIDGFFETYKGVSKWVRGIWKQVDSKKYVETILGRKRRLYNEINSGQSWQVESAHRMAVNFCIQGSSGDQLKTACLKLQPLLKELNSRIVLYIHDELIIDVPENIGVDNIRKIQDVMCNAISMEIGMLSDAECGWRWSQILSEDEIEKLHLSNSDEDDVDA